MRSGENNFNPQSLPGELKGTFIRSVKKMLSTSKLIHGLGLEILSEATPTQCPAMQCWEFTVGNTPLGKCSLKYNLRSMQVLEMRSLDYAFNITLSGI